MRQVIRQCLGFEGHDCNHSVTMNAKRCHECSKQNKAIYARAHNKGATANQIANRQMRLDDKTRVSLYSSWESCAKYWGDFQASKKWKSKREKIEVSFYG